jgi:hypothetical protein
MTPCLAALVKQVAELRTANLRACHCIKEFTLRRICPLGQWEKLAYYYSQLADLSHEPAAGNMFDLHFYY